MRAQPEGGAIERAGCVHLRSVPRGKVEDGAFWYFLFRQMVYPDPSHGPVTSPPSSESICKPFTAVAGFRLARLDHRDSSAAQDMVYNHLLPFLTEQPIIADLRDEECDFSPEVISGDASHACLTFGPALRRALTLSGASAARARYLSVLAMSTLGRLMTSLLLEVGHSGGHLHKPSADILSFVARRMDHEASLLPEDSCSPSELASLSQAAQALRDAVACSLPPAAPPPLPIDATSAGGEASEHPLFGRLRMDGLDLESLAGREGMARILRPAELSLVASEVSPQESILQQFRDGASQASVLRCRAACQQSYRSCICSPGLY